MLRSGMRAFRRENTGIELVAGVVLTPGSHDRFLGAALFIGALRAFACTLFNVQLPICRALLPQIHSRMNPAAIGYRAWDRRDHVRACRISR